MRVKIVAGLLLLLAIPALADQVVLKNGDRLTGSITKSDGKQLVIKTDYAGDVTVKFEAIHEGYAIPINPPSPATMRNQAGLTLGDAFTHKVRKGTVITQSLFFYPDLSQTGEYRGTFNFGTVTKLNRWLGWQNSFGDIYVSNPPIGTKKNDLQISTGLNFSFTH